MDKYQIYFVIKGLHFFQLKILLDALILKVLLHVLIIMNVNAGVDEVHDEPLHLIGQQPGEVVQIVVPKVILKKIFRSDNST